jgi:hypothetical protein
VWSWPPDAEAKRASLRGLWAMGARKPGSQGERDISVKTIVQGMPDDLAEPVVPSPCFFIARGPWVAASTRHSLRPLSIRRDTRDASPGHFVPRERECVSQGNVIASAAKFRRVGKGAKAPCPPSVRARGQQWWARCALPTLRIEQAAIASDLSAEARRAKAEAKQSRISPRRKSGLLRRSRASQ